MPCNSAYVLLVVVAGAASILAAAHADEPACEGRTAAAWALDLRSGDAAARRSAVYALLRIAETLPDPEKVMSERPMPKVAIPASLAAAGPALAMAIKDEDPYVRRVAALAVARLYGVLRMSVPDPAHPRVGAFSVKIGGLGDPALPAVIDVVREGTPADRKRAVWTLARMNAKPAEAEQALRDAFRDAGADEETRKGAIHALVHIGARSPETAQCYRECLGMDDNTRETALFGLALLGPEAAPFVLEVLVLTESASERAAFLAKEVVRIAGQAAIPHLTRHIEAARESPGRETRIAADVLAGHGRAASGAVPGLTALLDHTDPMLRASTAGALYRIRGDSAEDSRRFLRELTSGDPALAAAGEAGFAASGPGSAQALAEMLPGEGAPVKTAILRILGATGRGVPGVAPAIVKALGGGDDQVRAAAARSLAGIRPSEAESILALGSALADESAEVRQAAGAGIAAFADHYLNLHPLVANESPLVRESAVRVVGVAYARIGGLTITPHPVQRALSDPEWRVRACAAEVIGMAGARSASAAEDLKRAMSDDHPAVREKASEALAAVKG